MIRRLNCRPDRLDARDFKLTVAAPAALPPVVDLRLLCPPIYNQGDLGSCTGNAWCRMIEFLELADLRAGASGAPEDFAATYTPLSRLFLYYCERFLEGTVNSDAGAQLRDGMNALRKFGICEEALWPYSDAHALQAPAQPCYDSALKHTITNGFRLNDGDLVGMKACLASGFPFVGGLTLYESFMGDYEAASGAIPMPQAQEGVVGRHAVCCVGYDDERQALIFANSWGEGWGDKGYFYLPYAYITTPGLGQDFWTLRR